MPYPVAGAVWLPEQIGFHPVKYVRGLAKAFVVAGGQVFESSRVVSVQGGSPCRVRTAHGLLTAGQVVIATHYPILDRGLFFARMKVARSYCIAARVRDAPPRTMAISAGGNSRSIQFTGATVIVEARVTPRGPRGSHHSALLCSSSSPGGIGMARRRLAAGPHRIRSRTTTCR